MSRQSPKSPAEVSQAYAQLVATVQQLLADDGCAWHGVQTHQTLVRYLIEEAFELVDAIETGAPASQVQDELADVLYQVLFHAAIAERDREGYDPAGVALALNAKLIARHPHVFGDRGYMTVDELNEQWELLKADATGDTRRTLQGIVETLPTLARAEKIVDRLERAGQLAPVESQRLSVQDVGEQLVSLIRAAHASGVNADEALRVAMRDLERSAEE